MVDLDELAGGVSEPTVPLRPAPPKVREGPHLVQAGAIPGFGNELGVPKDRVLADHFNQGRVAEWGANGYASAIRHEFCSHCSETSTPREQDSMSIVR